MTKKLLNLVNWAICAGLVVMALVLARDVMNLALEPEKKDRPASKRQPVNEVAVKGLGYFAPVLGNNVFGLPPGELRPLGRSRAKESPPDARITLRGTVASGDGTGYAIIEDYRRNQMVYSTGDHIEGVGVLKRVERAKVLVGEREYELADIISVKTVVGARKSGRARKARNNGRLGQFTRKTAELSYIVDQEAVNAALENPDQIMTDARLLPNLVDGEQDGFIISEIVEGGIYQSLGLRNGDVLKRVNEFTISDPQAALQAFSALRGMDRIDLDIVRDGKQLTMTYIIR